MEERELSLELVLLTLMGSVGQEALIGCVEDKGDTCAEVKAVPDKVDDVRIVLDETEDARILLVGTG